MAETVVFPEIFGSHVTAFFTGKSPGAEIDRLSAIASVDKQKIYLPIQKHTDKVLILDFDMSPRISDAVITNSKGILLGVQVADCVPILLYDRRKSVVAAVHAGWRGTAAEILKKTIKAMMTRFISSPVDIITAIGPSIRWCCYHVGYDVLESVISVTGKGEYYLQRTDSCCLDLAGANKMQAMSMGIPEGNLWLSEYCTYCNPDRFYSYRYAKGSAGRRLDSSRRQGGFIGIL